VKIFLKKNEGNVFTYYWFNTVAPFFMCQQYFLVQNGKIFEIQHDQSLRGETIEDTDLHKLILVGKFDPLEKYMWRNYNFDVEKLKLIASVS
jgi:hypothetical protein